MNMRSFLVVSEKLVVVVVAVVVAGVTLAAA